MPFENYYGSIYYSEISISFRRKTKLQLGNYVMQKLLRELVNSYVTKIAKIIIDACFN